jgi:hypothetical protein
VPHPQFVGVVSVAHGIHRGVHRDVFMDLQNDAKANTLLSDRDLARYRTMVTDQGLGTSYYIGYVAQQLLKLGLDLNETPQPGFESLEYGFFRRLVRFAMSVSRSST